MSMPDFAYNRVHLGLGGSCDLNIQLPQDVPSGASPHYKLTTVRADLSLLRFAWIKYVISQTAYSLSVPALSFVYLAVEKRYTNPRPTNHTTLT